MDDKKVILTLEEYQKLKTDSEALQTAKEELKKDCKERGYYVELSFKLMHDGRFYNGRLVDFDMFSPLRLITKDEALKLAQETISDLEEDKEVLIAEVKELEDKLTELRGRNLFKRIFYRY